MKTSLFAKRGLVAMVVLTAAMVPMFALTGTGSLSLSGTVSETTSVTITADANASSLPLNVATTGLKIATVTELSNSKGGYTLTLSTSNGSSLKENLGVDTIPYTLQYGNNPVTFTGNSATLTTAASRSATSAGTTNTLYISFGAAFVNANTYADTLTFTITGK